MGINERGWLGRRWKGKRREQERGEEKRTAGGGVAMEEEREVGKGNGIRSGGERVTTVEGTMVASKQQFVCLVFFIT